MSSRPACFDCGLNLHIKSPSAIIRTQEPRGSVVQPPNALAGPPALTVVLTFMQKLLCKINQYTKEESKQELAAIKFGWTTGLDSCFNSHVDIPLSVERNQTNVENCDALATQMLGWATSFNCRLDFHEDAPLQDKSVHEDEERSQLNR